eukprot:321547-Rhodomonas_salina.1
MDFGDKGLNTSRSSSGMWHPESQKHAIPHCTSSPKIAGAHHLALHVCHSASFCLACAISRPFYCNLLRISVLMLRIFSSHLISHTPPWAVRNCDSVWCDFPVRCAVLSQGIAMGYTARGKQGTVLRACYAMSGTDGASGTLTCYRVLVFAMRLRGTGCCAELAEGMAHTMSVQIKHTVCRTEIGYGWRAGADTREMQMRCVRRERRSRNSIGTGPHYPCA